MKVKKIKYIFFLTLIFMLNIIYLPLSTNDGLFAVENKNTNFYNKLSPKPSEAEYIKKPKFGSFKNGQKKTFQSEIIQIDYDNKKSRDFSVGEYTELYPIEEGKSDDYKKMLLAYWLNRDALWKGILEETDKYVIFLEKVKSIEQLKRKFLHIANPRTMKSWLKTDLDSALNFFLLAYSFHLKPGPEPPNNETPYIETILNPFDIMHYLGIGYTRRHDKPGMWAVPELIHLDLKTCKILIEVEAEKGFISESIKEMKLKEIDNKIRDHDMDEIKYLIEQARKDEDKQALAGYLFKRSTILQKLDKLPAAIDDAKESFIIFEDIGNYKELAKSAIQLAIYYFENKDFNDALDKVDLYLNRIKNGEITECIDCFKYAIYIKSKVLKELGENDEYNIFQKELNEIYENFLIPVNECLDKLEEIDNISNLQSKEKKLMDSSKSCTKYSLYNFSEQVIRLETLMKQGHYEKAVSVSRKLRSTVRDIYKNNLPMERKILKNALYAEYQRGDYAECIMLLTELEDISKKISGANWLQDDGSFIARLYYYLEEYSKAEDALRYNQKRNNMKLINNPEISLDSFLENMIVSEDNFTKARLLLAENNNDLLEELMMQILEKANRMIENEDKPKRLELGIIALKEASEIYEATGNNKKALETVNKARNKVKLEENLTSWVDLTIRFIELKIKMGENIDEKDISHIEKIRDYIEKYSEYNLITVIRIDLILGKFSKSKYEFKNAKNYLKRAEKNSKHIGAFDELIKIYCLLGEIEEINGNLYLAIKNYKESAKLLAVVSKKIPNDRNKIGYREERTRAIPLLVDAQFKHYNKTKNEKELELLFEFIEKGKNASLIEIISGKNDAKVPTIKKIKEIMNEDSELIEYYVGARKKVYRIHVTKKTIQVNILEENYPSIEEYLMELKSIVLRDAKNDDLQFTTIAKKVAKILLPKELISKNKKNNKKIYIVPAGAMFIVPFTLLKDNDGYFLDEKNNFSFVYLPSAAILLNKHKEKNKNKKSIAYINPSLESLHGDFLSESQSYKEDLTAAMNSWVSTEIYWQILRTPSILIREVKQFNNVFIYSHARFNPVNPMDSYISLSPDKQGSYKLTAFQIATNKLNNDIWVIAGCSTGKGKIRAGDEVLGIPRALMIAGVSQVIVSLWEVDEKSSLELMIEFYKLLGFGITGSPSDALQTAIKNLRNSGANPYDWAPFIIIGE
jgi:CHAT domain-containing protein